MVRPFMTALSAAVLILVSGSGCSESKPTPVEPSAQQVQSVTDGETKSSNAAPNASEKPGGTADSKVAVKPDASQTLVRDADSKATKLPPELLSSDKLIPLNKQGTILADAQGKRVLLKTQVCLTNGQLEMLLCKKQTKEHESILTFDGEAYMIHATLVAWGLEKGTPGKYDSEKEKSFTATGPKIDVFLNWVDEAGKLQRKPGQFWVRRSIQRYFGDKFEKLPEDLTLPEDFNLRYDPVNKYLHWFGPMSDQQRTELLAMSKDETYRKLINQIHDDSQPRQMDAEWVFVGSYESDDGEEGKRYQAEGGYVICVANFPMALLDLSTESSATGSENLVYEAWTERIPPRGSEVLVELIPRPQDAEVSKDSK